MLLTSALDACLHGLLAIWTWSALSLLLTGVLIGAMVGILPGIGGAATLALLLPFTFGLSAVQAFALLMGVAAVTATTGDLTSILLGIPGETTTAATVVDGHPMARRGEAARAIGASLVSSLTGSVFGALTVAFTIPVAAFIARSVGSPELFMLALLGISFVAPLTAASRLKGLAAGGLGLLLSTVGLDPLGATPRFTFGHVSLFDGIGPIPLTLGLFAIPEIVELASAPPGLPAAPAGGRLSEGIRDAVRLWTLVLRSSAIGAAMGVLPGIGGSVAQWVAYADAGKRSDDPSQFGHGAIEGVIAPSAANNATLGGALVPMLAFGIPGGLMSAILLGGLTLKGIVPGPSILVPEAQGGHLTFAFTLVWFLVVANIVAVILSALATPALAKILTIKTARLVPFLLLLMYIGAFTERRAMEDLVITTMFGLLGLAFVRYGWPRAPALMGLVLGPLAENRLFLSNQAYGAAWLVRPGVVVIAVVMILGVIQPFSWRRKTPRAARESRVKPDTSRHRDEPLFIGAFLAVLVAALVETRTFTWQAALLPRLVCGTTIAFLSAALVFDFRSRATHGVKARSADHAPNPNPLLAWIPIFLGLIWGLGFLIGAPIAILGYLLGAGRERPLHAVLLAGVAFVVLDVVMSRLLDMQFPPGVLRWGG